MRRFKFYTQKVQQEFVEVVLDNVVPYSIAQYIGAIINTNHRDEDNLYELERIHIGFDFFPDNPTTAGMYIYRNKEIKIDVYKCCLATVQYNNSMLDHRYFAFEGLLSSVCHELIHARNAKMYTSKYEYDAVADRSAIAQELDESSANEEKEELLYCAGSKFDIDPEHKDVDWLLPFLRKACKHMNYPESMVDPREVIMKFRNSGYRCYSWREFVYEANLARVKKAQLIPLPEDMDKVPIHKPVQTEEVAKEEVPIEACSEDASSTFDSEGFIDPSLIFEDEDYDRAGVWSPEDEAQEPVIPPADGHGGVPEQPEATAEDNTEVQPEHKPLSISDEELYGQEDALDIPNPEAIDFETKKAITRDIDAILERCAVAFYEKCGWDGKGRFKNLGGILEPVYIGDIRYRKFLKGVYTANKYGNGTVFRENDGYVKGLVASVSGLPMFHLIFDWFGEIKEKRVVPQNPVPKDGVYKWTHNAVLGGEKLTWVINHNDNSGKSPFTHKYNKGNLIPIGKLRDEREAQGLLEKKGGK